MECSLGSWKERGDNGCHLDCKQIQDNMLERNNNLHVAFVDLEKAFDRLPREVIFLCPRKKWVPHPIVNLVEEMHNGPTTRVRTVCGLSAEFPVTVGLHQGSALSRFLIG